MRLADHPPQARMGVDDILGIKRNHQMMLRIAEREQQDVARTVRTVRRDKARLRRRREPDTDRYVAQSVAARRHRLATGSGERDMNQPDAIESGLRITPMEAEPAAHEAERGLRNSRSARAHDWP
jgi:hypothetical protein